MGVEGWDFLQFLHSGVNYHRPWGKSTHVHLYLRMSTEKNLVTSKQNTAYFTKLSCHNDKLEKLESMSSNKSKSMCHAWQNWLWHCLFGLQTLGFPDSGFLYTQTFENGCVTLEALSSSGHAIHSHDQAVSIHKPQNILKVKNVF